MRREQEHGHRPTSDQATVTTLPIPENPYQNQRINNHIQLVANPKKTDPENNPDPHLIAQATKILKDAKSGKLKGLGFLADYGTEYTFGLEGSYLEDPAAAIVPLKRLDRRIMDRVEDSD